jgi:arsenate reductase-like glutaredoxin family protein
MSIGTSLCAGVVIRSRWLPRLVYARVVAGPIIQIFGKKKDSETRKAERWFKERGLKVQSVELSEKGLSPGELKSVAARVGGVEALIDRDGKRYVDKGLKYSAPTGPRIEALLIEDPLLLKTPIVRRGTEATLGFAPEVWETWK